jgi:hypothetical protein
MTNALPARLTPRVLGAAAAAGVALGIVYALSPLTVWFAIAMAVIVNAAIRGVEGNERRWLLAVLVTGIVLRVAAIGGLFLVTNHAKVSFGSFFGDEEYFIRRALWLRNIALGLPVHVADLIYAFDQYSATTYLYFLAFVQVLVGPAPYGVHLLSVAFYVSGSVLLYRIVRPAFGRMPALLGLALLLFLPTLFAWSISALKDPVFFLLTASALALSEKVARGPGLALRVASAAAIAGLVAALESIRPGSGGALAAASVVGGLAIAAVVSRPRLLIASIVFVPIVAGALLSRPSVQVKAYSAVRIAAQQHWGHVATPGYVYHLLDDRFYVDRGVIEDMGFREAGRFVVRALERYVTVPLPWEAESRWTLAFLPAQIVWYILVALVPVGFVYGCRRDPLLASLLLAHALVAATVIALSSGNIGTLVRHRDLALPFIAWLSAVGACELLTRARGWTFAKAWGQPAES